jgi:hypothetical protein
MDNMHNGELYGRVLRVNFAKPQRGGTGGALWSSDPDAYMVEADAVAAEKDTTMVG